MTAMLATQLPREACAFALPYTYSSPSDQLIPMSVPLDMSNSIPRRIPKLVVRNRTKIEVNSSSEESNNENRERPDRFSVQPDERTYELSTTRSKHQRTDSRQSHSQKGKVPGKRKSAGVLGFLTLKEPSTSALEEFAAQERRKMVNQRVLPGVSSQKLPDHVPKVNSKWDGLPQLKTEKDKTRASHERANRNSTTSVNSHHSGGSDRFQSHSAKHRPFGSLSSVPIGRRSQESSRHVAHGRRSSSQNRSTLSSPTSSQIHPAFRDRQEHSASPPGLYMADASVGADQDSSSGPETPGSNLPEKLRPTIEGQSSSVGEFSRLRTGVCEDVNVAEPYHETQSVKTSRSGSTYGEAVTQTILEEYINQEPQQARKTNTHSDSSYVRNFSHVSKFSPLDGTCANQSIKLTPESHACLSPPSSGTTTGSRPVGDASSKMKSYQAAEARIVAPVVGPVKSNNKEVLPWEIFEPPAENQTSVAPHTVKHDSRKFKRFSTRIGRM
ncbi:hypothetical protein HII31_02220 [Pseudocercospora fuligena]|uniref:Uncharacterized protein n=1 Tax=Pseudocercospora fuligena TaxID=685502 RepID=A0A8H6RTC6_9PEZI|nr:hypothetical protein HII31_02220 [Pseudocercospora fuligena]